MTFDLAPILDRLGVEYDPDKAGNQKVNCPAHEDNVASASVNLDEGLLNCFGCDIKGDAITLLMRVEGLEFGEAKRLAQELSREVDRPVRGEPGRGDSYLPRKQGSRPGRRAWVSPWSRKRP